MPQAVIQDSSHPVVPSHQPLIDKGLIRPLVISPVNVLHEHSPSTSMEDPTSPTSAGADMSSSPLPIGDSPSVTFHRQFNFINLTGNWHTDEAVVSEQMLHAPGPRHACVPDVISLDASIMSPSVQNHQLTKGLRKTRRSQSYPYIDARASCPSSRTHLSAPSIKGRKKPSQPKLPQLKPPLACLFCRSRKIACGAPPAGSEKLSCG
jgi:hypothetical protein